MAKKKNNIPDDLPVDDVRNIFENIFIQVFGESPYGDNFPKFMGFSRIILCGFEEYIKIIFEALDKQQ